jgi:thiol:disulfide interchange protein DsbD
MRRLLLLLSWCLLPWQAGAVPPADASRARTDEVEVRLVAETAAVQPGGTLVLGVQQRIAPHWHTYWRNPGDSGLATQIAWTLPRGASAGAIDWPVPQRFQVGPIVNQGYADEVTLLTTVQVPADAVPGGTFEVKAAVDWLVCQESCIPQQAVLALALPVRAGAPAAGPDAPVIAAARQRLPQPAPWPVQWQRRGEALQLVWPAGADGPGRGVFFPGSAGQVVTAAPQRWLREGDRQGLQLVAGEVPPAADGAVDGVLVVDGRAWELRATAGTAWLAPAPPADDAPTLWVALLLALAGGAVLNLMPCVFPVLSIKALSLLRQSEQSRGTAVAHALSYAGGVVASFGVLAGALIALQAGGAEVGWGFQFQSPGFVLALAWLMLAVGLNLSGVYAPGGSLAGVGSGLADREGWVGSFFTGVLATVVATPCTAPFMGTAIGWALTQPAGVTLAVFTALGLGLAAPYVLLGLFPALQRRLPRPGAWMDRFKQALAFPMYAAAAWLVWVLAQQAGADGVAVALAGGVAVALAAWLYGSTRQAGVAGQRWGSVAAVLVLGSAVAAAVASLPAPGSGGTQAQAAEGAWQPYTAERLQSLRAEGRPVFVNLTAAWCLTCLVNERVALGQASVQAAFEQAGIVALKGDWTQRDERITRLLAEHGRSGVPLYLYYPPGRDAGPVVLPQLLTPQAVVGAVTAAR